jgi:phosphonatase-like hydrolase
MTIDLVVFDVAGTTVHDAGSVAAALAAAVRERGVDVGLDEVEHVMGLAKPVALRQLLGGSVDDAALQLAFQSFRHHMLEHYLRSPSVRPVDGVEATFFALREMGVKIALDTGFDRKILDAILLRLGWFDVVDFTVASDEVAAGRPAPDMIRRVMAATGIHDPKRVAKAGDTPIDMQEGHNAGCGAVIGVLTGTGSAEELEAAGADQVIPSVTMIAKALFDVGGVHPSRFESARR